nr:unnamed protein product [Meloidogyne enterolobii]
MSTNLEKFAESWRRPLSAVHEENFEEPKISTSTKQKFKGNEKTQKKKEKKFQKNFPPSQRQLPFLIKKWKEEMDGW